MGEVVNQPAQRDRLHPRSDERHPVAPEKEADSYDGGRQQKYGGASLSFCRHHAAGFAAASTGTVACAANPPLDDLRVGLVRPECWID